MKIVVFQEAGFAPLPTYTADDVRRASGAATVGAAGLAGLTRADADVLVLPYVDGTFGEPALAGLARFHAAGGGLVVLGDLPHRDRWYPYRNMEGWRLHLTRCNGQCDIAGLSDAGRRVLGWDELPDAGFFAGRAFDALRVTGYPLDATHILTRSRDEGESWRAAPIVAIERYSGPFLGARFAMVGCNGGEPRENVCGVCDLPWTFNPGLLTRAWAGMDALLVRLLEWVAPRGLAGRIDVGERPTVTVRDLAPRPRRVTLKVTAQAGHTLWQSEATKLGPGQHRFHPGWLQWPAGAHALTLTAEDEDGSAVLHEATHHVLPADVSTEPGFGFSTFWAFPGGHVVPAFSCFCREMRDLGCQYVRVNIPWEDVEPGPGVQDWHLPDEMIAVARELDLRVQFWMFPTTRGSGLGDAGVPAWTLREPALAADGRPGLFPSLWSPFYRKHYFATVRAFAQRYAQAPELDRFVIDFGNSDFPYGYFYYGCDNSVFDHAPAEQAAWRRYTGEDAPVPTPDQEVAWRRYLGFRHWSLQQGLHCVQQIIRDEAPAKLPPDLPGHGAGSIADLTSFGLEAKARYGAQEPPEEAELGRLHNAGPQWGGEAWQVAGGYREYDDALFQSLRLGADYLTIPGPDLGVYGDGIARLGFIRRMIMGARRDAPAYAVIDGLAWNNHQSLANVAARLDQEADLLGPRHRHDLGVYRLVVMPPKPWRTPGTVTGGGAEGLLPTDQAWHARLRAAVEAGLNLLVFPGTVAAEGLPLCDALDLRDVRFGPRLPRLVAWPATLGGGTSRGAACRVDAQGEVMVRDVAGEAVLVRRGLGRGAIWLAGYDTEPDSLDGRLDPACDADHGSHTLVRLLAGLGIASASLASNQANAWKSVVRRGSRTFLLLFSHRATPLAGRFDVRLEAPAATAVDLATDERFAVTSIRDGWHRVEVTVHPRRGRYIMFTPS